MGKKLKYLVVCLPLFLISCLSRQENTLHVYSVLDSRETASYIKVFEQKTNISVKWVRLSTGEALARLEAEKNNPQVGVLFGGPSPEFMVAKRKGLITPYKPTSIDYPMEGHYHDSTWHWAGIYFAPLAFASNDDFLKENGLKPPQSWEELLKPEYKNKVSMAFPYTSGTAYTILSTLLQLKGAKQGWDYIEKLDKQIHHYNKSGSAAVTQVGLGEIGVGIAFSHDVIKKGKVRGYPVSISFPAEGTGHEIGCVALVKNGPKQELGKQFINFFASKEGQDLFHEFYRIPIHPRAKVAAGAVQAEDVQLIEFNPQKAADEQPQIISKWRDLTGR